MYLLTICELFAGERPCHLAAELTATRLRRHHTTEERDLSTRNKVTPSQQSIMIQVFPHFSLQQPQLVISDNSRLLQNANLAPKPLDLLLQVGSGGRQPRLLHRAAAQHVVHPSLMRKPGIHEASKEEQGTGPLNMRSRGPVSRIHLKSAVWLTAPDQVNSVIN